MKRRHKQTWDKTASQAHGLPCCQEGSTGEHQPFLFLLAHYLSVWKVVFGEFHMLFLLQTSKLSCTTWHCLMYKGHQEQQWGTCDREGTAQWESCPGAPLHSPGWTEKSALFLAHSQASPLAFSLFHLAGKSDKSAR